MVRPASDEGIEDTSPLFVHAIHLRGRHDRTCPLLRVNDTQYVSLVQLRGRHGESICGRVPTRKHVRLQRYNILTAIGWEFNLRLDDRWYAQPQMKALKTLARYLTVTICTMINRQ